MIGTLPADANPRTQLRERLADLQRIEIPRLEAEAAVDAEISAVSLDRAKREADDIGRLLTTLDERRPAAPGHERRVEVNDRVVIRPVRSRRTESMVVHDGALDIRAPGFISVRSPLGAAVVGRSVGDTVEVRGPGGSFRCVIEEVCSA